MKGIIIVKPAEKTRGGGGARNKLWIASKQENLEKVKEVEKQTDALNRKTGEPISTTVKTLLTNPVEKHMLLVNTEHSDKAYTLSFTYR